ncbi:MAG: MFS transporter [Hoylesella enoeca]|uniref:MFS transporter n=1 Tax=Hoylesella enoeca TaxID=76123 RepID=UPI003FA12829
MDTQNTPIHIRLWHKDFWVLALANLLLTTAVYMLIIALPESLLHTLRLSPQETGAVMGAYGVGLFLLGPFCSWLVQEYRRSNICVGAVAVVVGVLIAFGYVQRYYVEWHLNVTVLIALRLILGAAFGLAQMVLCSTLVIDKCESFQRTEANHHASWFGRFALSIGSLFAIILLQAHYNVYIAAAITASLSIALIKSVRFPFRAPEENVKHMALDRFFLPQGKWLFLNLMLMTMIIGLVMTIETTVLFYVMIMAGFLLALLSEKFVFADADLKSETVTGLIVIGTALLLILNRQYTVAVYIAPFLIGFGIGIIGSRFLLFFIKLSRHCQRGTSQSTFMLAWESGITLGISLGYGYFYGNRAQLIICCLVLTVVSLFLYNLFVHPWYMKHRNR